MLPNTAYVQHGTSVRSSEKLAKRSAIHFNGIEHDWLTFYVGATFALADAADVYKPPEGREARGVVALTI